MGAEMKAAGGARTVVLRETHSGPYQIQAQGGNKTFVIDQPVAAGGLGSGPDPFDLLCAAIGSCAMMTIRIYANQRQWPLHRVAIAVDHFRLEGDDHHHFERVIELEGDLDDPQRQALRAIADRSPVHQVLDHSSTVSSRLGLIESPEATARRVAAEHWIALQQALRAS